MNTVNLQIDYHLFHKKKSPNWKQLSIDGAHRVRKLFEEEDVDVVLSADDFFLRFRKTTKMVLASKTCWSCILHE